MIRTVLIYVLRKVVVLFVHLRVSNLFLTLWNWISRFLIVDKVLLWSGVHAIKASNTSSIVLLSF